MTLVCKSCGAENAADAASCWQCEAAGETLRGKKAGPPFALIASAVVVIAAATGAGIVQALPHLLGVKGQQQAAPVPSSTPPPPPVAPSQVSAEAALLADRIDGPFFREFKEALPGDYSAIMGFLLVQAPDPIRDMARFDALLGERLGAMRLANAQDIAGAADSVLDEMADNMLRAMRTPEYCQPALDPTMGGISAENRPARQVAAQLNTSIIRAIASGRQQRAARAAPTATQVADFNVALEQMLTPSRWQAYQSGSMDALPPDEQCAIHVGFWDVIAGYPPALSAVWTAQQMAQPSQ